MVDAKTYLDGNKREGGRHIGGLTDVLEGAYVGCVVGEQVTYQGLQVRKCLPLY